LPDWPTLEKWLAALRKKFTPSSIAEGKTVTIPLPKDLPTEWLRVVESTRVSLMADLPRLLDPALPVRRLLTQTPAFVGRYFWREDALAEVEHFERQNSAVWDKATGGHDDESSLLTLFLRIAAGSSHASLLTNSSANSLIRKIRKSGIDRELPRQLIREHAPHALQDDYLQLWNDFAEEAEPTLRSDLPQATQDALALLRRECNLAA